MKKNYVFDSYAFLAFFQLQKGHETISSMLTEISAGSAEGYMSVINLGEIFYMGYRKLGGVRANQGIKTILTMNIDMVNVNLEMSIQAAKLKATYKISYADAFAAALTQTKNGILITGDPEFKALEKIIKIRFI